LGHFSREKLAERVDFSISHYGYPHKLTRARGKEFFLSLLGSASTKREAKAYLSRFKSSPSQGKTQTKEKELEPEPEQEQTAESAKPGVNLGSFYGASRSVYDSPVFRQ
jgi:amino-acid N-acetyltransferase